MTAVVENTQVVTIDSNTIQVVTIGTQGAAGVGVPSGGTAGQVLAKIDATNYNTNWITVAGTVTSVAMTVPTGLSVSGSPITSAGTLAVTLAAGYVIPTQAALDGKQDAITLTTTGTSGAATLDGTTLNIPQYSGGAGSVAWGAITGTLSNQTDLQNALNAKQNTITTGSTAQYLRGDLSLATFPTAVSSFTNDEGYLVSSALTPYALLSGATFSGAISATNLSGTNTGDQTSIVGISGTKAQFDTACSDGDFLYVGDITVGVIGALNTLAASFGCIIGDGTNVIAVGQSATIVMPFAMTITGWTIVECSDTATSSSIVVDVWKDTYANYPPTVADTIAGSEKPTLSSATKGQDLTLSSWTTSVTAGDIIKFNVDSVTSAKRVAITVIGTRTS